ncbi:MAG: hypothetical protein AAGL24_27555 [Pseudomonadota bacterium]
MKSGAKLSIANMIRIPIRLRAGRFNFPASAPVGFHMEMGAMEDLKKFGKIPESGRFPDLRPAAFVPVNRGSVGTPVISPN